MGPRRTPGTPLHPPLVRGEANPPEFGTLFRGRSSPTLRGSLTPPAPWKGSSAWPPGRALKNLRGRPGFDDMPIAENMDIMSDQAGEVHGVGHDDHRLPVAAPGRS